MKSTHDIDTTQPRHNDAPSKVKLIIHHQFPGVELVSPVYGSDGAECCLLPDQKVDVDSMMQTDFDIDPTQEESIGILMYKLQRKYTGQYDKNNAICIQFVVIWKVNSSGEFRLASRLIEHDKYHTWDRDELMKLAKRYVLFSIRRGPTEETWLMRDNTVLMINLNATREEECYKLEITIAETNIRDDTRRSEHVYLNR
jgi:hypothetical protein